MKSLSGGHGLQSSEVADTSGMNLTGGEEVAQDAPVMGGEEAPVVAEQAPVDAQAGGKGKRGRKGVRKTKRARKSMRKRKGGSLMGSNTAAAIVLLAANTLYKGKNNKSKKSKTYKKYNKSRRYKK